MFLSVCSHLLLIVFFFNDPATTEIYTLSLHDALPIFGTGLAAGLSVSNSVPVSTTLGDVDSVTIKDRKSTRLNSSHVAISYAVFCLKKKKKTIHFYLTDHEHHHTFISLFSPDHSLAL